MEIFLVFLSHFENICQYKLWGGFSVGEANEKAGGVVTPLYLWVYDGVSGIQIHSADAIDNSISISSEKFPGVIKWNFCFGRSKCVVRN